MAGKSVVAGRQVKRCVGRQAGTMVVEVEAAFSNPSHNVSHPGTGEPEREASSLSVPVQSKMPQQVCMQKQNRSGWGGRQEVSNHRRGTKKVHTC